MKWITIPTIIPKIKSSKITQIRTNDVRDGTEMIVAIIVPLNTISNIESLDFLSDNICQILKIVIKTKDTWIFDDTLYLANVNFHCLASYKGAYSNEQSLNFVIPIIVILFLGIIYIMTQRADSGFVSFILIGAATLTMFYWVRVLKKMTKDQKPLYTQAREQETKNWVYDLIKNEGEFVFVAEVPGPEDKIAVRLVDGILYVRGTMGFSKEIPIEGAGEMQIFDFKYRNGVLTLKIK